MSQVLDSIIKKVLVIGPESISADYTSIVADISGVENAFSIQVDYSNGVGLDMDLVLEVSVDGQSYVRISESLQNVTDATGTHLWDVSEMGVVFVRVAFVINSGSCDIDKTNLTAKRRH